jgi:hypothetical protein
VKFSEKHGAAWKTNEKHQLRNCWDRGMTLEQIAYKLKRSEHAICMQLVALKICSNEDQALSESDARYRQGNTDFHTGP